MKLKLFKAIQAAYEVGLTIHFEFHECFSKEVQFFSKLFTDLCVTVNWRPQKIYVLIWTIQK